LNWKVKLITLFATIMTLSALVQLHLVVPYVSVHNVQPWWMPFLPLVLLSVAFGCAWLAIWPVVADRRRVEEKVRWSEERLQDLFDNASDLIQSVSPDGDFLFVNKTWRETLGYSQTEVASLNLWDIIHPDSMAHCREIFQRVISGETVSGVEAVFVAKDGRSIVIEGNVSCRREDGKPVSTRGIFRDVTEKKRVEAALDEALVKYETIITNMSEVVMITQPDGTINYLSPSCEKVMGYSARELTGTSPWIIHPDDSPGMKKGFSGALRGGIGKDLEYRIYTGGGEIKWVSHSFSPVMVDGKVQVVVSTIKDITARKQVLVKLEESEARYQNLVENSADGIMVIQKREVKFVNRAVLRMFGLKNKSEIEGHSFIDLVAPEQRELMRQRGRSRARGTIVPDHYEFTARRKDGATFDCDFSVSSVVLQGVAVRQAILRNITERKQAERAVRESEERMAAFMDSATDSFLLFDAELNLVDLNRHSLKYRKVRKEKLIGKNICELAPGVRENGRYEKYLEVLETGEPFFTEDVIVKPEGNRYRLVRAFKMGSGMGIMIANITERKEMELRLQQQMEALDIQNEELITQSNELMRNQHELMQKSLQLEEVCRGQSRFLASISHELRTPLNAIIGFSELIEDGITGDINAEQRDCVGDILISGHHLLELINDILDTSKMEAGKMTLNIEELPVISAIDEAVKVVRPLLRRENLTLEEICEDDLPLVKADGNRVKQVVMNLLSNAIKFTPSGGAITVRACRRGGQVLVSVADTGRGIKKADRQNIFKAYTQSDTLPVKKTEGTGLGLKLCNQFIELMGGAIWLESSSSKGSVFSFTLPLADRAGDVSGDTGAETGSDNVSLEEENGIATEAYQSWRDGIDYGIIRAKAGFETGENSARS
jgi:PAS domain S-box-containing protein